jgi:hypothetical protein
MCAEEGLRPAQQAGPHGLFGLARPVGATCRNSDGLPRPLRSVGHYLAHKGISYGIVGSEKHHRDRRNDAK